MKRNLLTITTVMMMVLSLSSFANEKTNPSLSGPSASIVADYLNASVLGHQNDIKEMLADNFEYFNTANKQKSSKEEYVKFLNETNNSKYDCVYTYEVLDQTGKSAVAKATFKFDNFTRVDILSLQETAEGWKISEVITNYK